MPFIRDPSFDHEALTTILLERRIGPLTDAEVFSTILALADHFLLDVDAAVEEAVKRRAARGGANAPSKPADGETARTARSGPDRRANESEQQTRRPSAAATMRAELNDANDQRGHRRAIFDVAASDFTRAWMPEDIEERLSREGFVDRRGEALSLATIDKAMQRMAPHLLIAGEKIKSPASGRMRRTYRVNRAALGESRDTPT